MTPYTYCITILHIYCISIIVSVEYELVCMYVCMYFLYFTLYVFIILLQHCGTVVQLVNGVWCLNQEAH